MEKCRICGEYFHESELKNGICLECRKSMNYCPTCGSKQACLNTGEWAICQTCGDIFPQILFDRQGELTFHKSNIFAICMCSGLMEYERFESDSAPFVVLKCKKCKKEKSFNLWADNNIMPKYLQ
jgi:hypothetical protein